MNLAQIRTTVIGYADRYDAEVLDFFSLWLPVVEGRINSVLTTRLSLTDSTIPVTSTSDTFVLPDDLLFLKQVKLATTDELILSYVNELYFSNLLAQGFSRPFYTVTNAAIRLAWDLKGDGSEELHIRYEQKLPPLVADLDDNWLSLSGPQTYIFGLLAELYAFVKDAEAATLWEARFKLELDNIENTDHRTNWSGITTLVQKLG